MKIPTIEEIEQYIREKEYTHCDAMEFYYHYDSKGWTVGKAKMTKWKSSVAGWHLRNKKQAEMSKKEFDNTYVGKFNSLEQRAKAAGLPARPGESYEDWDRRITKNERVQRTRH